MPTTEEERPTVDTATDEAAQHMDGGTRFTEELARLYRDTIGDLFWTQTKTDDGRHDRDEVFIATYIETRARVEAYWHNFAMAPSRELQQLYLRQNAEESKAHVELAIKVLTPIEKACFASPDQLFGWIASGMRPLFDGADRVPLERIIEPHYLTQTGLELASTSRGIG
jgi:hypothetical protein